MQKYHIIIYDRLSKRLNNSSREHIEETIKALETTQEMLGSIEWYLVGGLGTDLQQGVISRHHTDIDIEIDTKYASEAMALMKKQNYTLVQKIITTNMPVNKRIGVYTECRSEECTPLSRRRTRFIKNINDTFQEKNMLSYLDVTFKKETPQGTLIGYKNQHILLPEQYAGPIITLGSINIRTRNPIYHLHLKEHSKNCVDKYDVEILNRLMS